ncbi:MAG: GNAT family N-acetyltransferase [Halobacteria archaeon]|nr:GNAT family N-acetyltransferase [Halobacteria archaeon]
MTQVEIREARPEDRDAVFEFASETWSREEIKEGKDEGEEEDADDEGISGGETTPRDGWDYIPEVWDDWLEADEGVVLVAVPEDGDDAVGVVRVTAFLTGEAWLEGMRVHPDHRREGVATALTDEALDVAAKRNAEVVRSMTFEWNEQGVELLESLGFERSVELRHARGFGFPYGSQIEEATFDESLDVIRETDAYDAVGGLHATSDWKMVSIPETVTNFREGTEVLAFEEDDDVRSVMICDGVRTNTSGVEERTELVLGFVWCDPEYASQLALDIRGEARDRNLNDALVFLPDDEEYIGSFEQAGFDVSDLDYVYERDISGREW